MEIRETLEKVQTSASEAVTEIRDLGELKQIGDNCRQGDIIITLVEENHPRDARTENTQLAPGTSMGSRHIVEGDCEVYEPHIPQEERSWGMVPVTFVKVAGCNIASGLIGPVVVTKGETLFTHPEHAMAKCLGGRTYQVSFERDFLGIGPHARITD